MKNTKAIFLIVLGSFIAATGFAFAENAAYEQLKLGFDRSAPQDLPVVSGQPAPAVNAAAPAASAPAAPAAAPAVPAASPPAPAPAPAPTAGEKAKEFLKKNMGAMVMTGVGAYLGMALLGGPAGLLIGGLFMFALMFLGSL